MFFRILISASCAFATLCSVFGHVNKEYLDDPSSSEALEGYIRRRLNVLDDASDPKTTEVKGYLCTKGWVSWGSYDNILQELPSFVAAYKERDKVLDDRIGNFGLTNFGGNGLYHSFIVWTVLKKLRPTVVIESGVKNGFLSYFITKACEEWAPVFVRVDPSEIGWDGLTGNHNPLKTVNLRGKAFKDISKINWDNLFLNHGLSKSDKMRSLVILDDHQDQLRRLEELNGLGFRHVIVANNYLPGVGDHFSVRDACDGAGHLRLAFNRNPDRPADPKRCDNFHSFCDEKNPLQMQEYAIELDRIVQTYWEGPPLAPLERPYETLKAAIEDKAKGAYEGPSLWTEQHSKLVIECSKAPLFDTAKEASEATGFPTSMLSFESGRYFHIAYLELGSNIIG